MRTRAEGSERIVSERDFKKCELYVAKGTHWQCQWEFTIPSPAPICQPPLRRLFFVQPALKLLSKEERLIVLNLAELYIYIPLSMEFLLQV